MLAEQVRGDQVETYHDGAVAVVRPDGTPIFTHGDIDRPFFYRSSAKPFQAFVAMECGAELEPLELAMACASHRGFPVHVSIVRSMLASSGLDESALRCPHDWPLDRRARDMLIAGGETETRRVWHNCSGKHAGFLRACVASGWDTTTYLDPEHPLQRRIIEFATELGDFDVGPVAVDGCGAPVLRTTVRVMATMFARLATEDRFSKVRVAMHRYPGLTGSNNEGDSQIATAVNAVAKGGAVGCVGVGLLGQVGAAAKAWDGSNLIAYQAVSVAMAHSGYLPQTAQTVLREVMEPPVYGGGEVVGRYVSKLTPGHDGQRHH